MTPQQLDDHESYGAVEPYESLDYEGREAEGCIRIEQFGFGLPRKCNETVNPGSGIFCTAHALETYREELADALRDGDEEGVAEVRADIAKLEGVSR